MNNASVAYSLNESQALSHAAERGNVPADSGYKFLSQALHEGPTCIFMHNVCRVHALRIQNDIIANYDELRLN